MGFFGRFFKGEMSKEEAAAKMKGAQVQESMGKSPLEEEEEKMAAAAAGMEKAEAKQEAAEMPENVRLANEWLADIASDEVVLEQFPGANKEMLKKQIMAYAPEVAGQLADKLKNADKATRDGELTSWLLSRLSGAEAKKEAA